MENNSELPSKAQSSKKIAYWSGVILPEELQDFQKLLRELANGEGRKGLYFERLATSSKKIKLYSIRINQEMRLLLTEQKMDNGEHVLVALALTRHYKGWENDADNIKKITHYLKHLDADFSSLSSLEPEPLTPAEQNNLEAAVVASELQEVLCFSGNFLSLKPDQKQASQMHLPGLLLGMPGTGKTVTAIECMQALHQSHPEAKLYYVSSHVGLVREVAQSWSLQYPDIPAIFSPLEALLAEFFTPIPKQSTPAGLWTLSDFLKQQQGAKKQKAMRNQKNTLRGFALLDRSLAAEKIYELLQLTALQEYHANSAILEYLEHESGLAFTSLHSDLREYRAYLIANGLYDLGISPVPSLLSSSSSSADRILIVDEVQNIPPSILHALGGIFGERMLGVGDPYQALSYQPMDKVWRALFNNPDCRILNQSLRCPAPVVRAAQQLLGLLHVVGGDYIKGYGGYNSLPELPKDALRPLFLAPEEVAAVHVIYADPDQRVAAEKKYGAKTPFIHCVDAVGGLTFEKVILFGFLDDKCLNALDESHYAAAKRAELRHNPGKNAERKPDVEAWLHRLLVAMTRCTDTLYLGLPGKTKAQQRLLQYFGIEPQTQADLRLFSDPLPTESVKNEPYSDEAFAAIFTEMQKLQSNGAHHLLKKDIERLMQQKRLSRVQANKLESLIKTAPKTESIVHTQPLGAAKKAPVRLRPVKGKTSNTNRDSYESETIAFWKRTVQQTPSILSVDMVLEKLFFGKNPVALRYPELREFISNKLMDKRVCPESVLADIATLALDRAITFSENPVAAPSFGEKKIKFYDYLRLVRLYLRSCASPDKNVVKTVEQFATGLLTPSYEGKEVRNRVFLPSLPNTLLASDDTNWLYCILTCCLESSPEVIGLLVEHFEQSAWQSKDFGYGPMLFLQAWFLTLRSLKGEFPNIKKIEDFEYVLYKQFTAEQWLNIFENTPFFQNALIFLPIGFYLYFLPRIAHDIPLRNHFFANKTAMEITQKLFWEREGVFEGFRTQNPGFCYLIERHGDDTNTFYIPPKTLRVIYNALDSLLYKNTQEKSEILTRLFSPKYRWWMWGILHNACNEKVKNRATYNSIVTMLTRYLLVRVQVASKECAVWEAVLGLEPLLNPQYVENPLIMEELQTRLLLAEQESEYKSLGYPLAHFLEMHSSEQLHCIAKKFYKNAVLRAIDQLSAQEDFAKSGNALCLLMELSTTIERFGWLTPLQEGVISAEEFLQKRRFLPNFYSAIGLLPELISLVSQDAAVDCKKIIKTLVKEIAFKLSEPADLLQDSRLCALFVMAFEFLLKDKIQSRWLDGILMQLEEKLLFADLLVFIIENQHSGAVFGENSLHQVCLYLFTKLSYHNISYTELVYFGRQMTLADWACAQGDEYWLEWMKNNKLFLRKLGDEKVDQAMLVPRLVVLMFKKYVIFKNEVLGVVRNNPELCAKLTEDDIDACNFLAIEQVLLSVNPSHLEDLGSVLKAAAVVLKQHPNLLQKNDPLKRFCEWHGQGLLECSSIVSFGELGFFTPEKNAQTSSSPPIEPPTDESALMKNI